MEKKKKELEAKLEEVKKNFDLNDPSVEDTYAEIGRLQEDILTNADKISRLNKENAALRSGMEKIREAIAQ